MNVPKRFLKYLAFSVLNLVSFLLPFFGLRETFYALADVWLSNAAKGIQNLNAFSIQHIENNLKSNTILMLP